LYFEYNTSPELYYYKDYRSSPGLYYEFIEFESSVDVREVEAFINFYKGSCPGGARGEVRVEFDGRIYGLPFFIPAEQGNLGRSGLSQQEFWTPIPLQKALHRVQQPIATRRTDWIAVVKGSQNFSACGAQPSRLHRSAPPPTGTWSSKRGLLSVSAGRSSTVIHDGKSIRQGPIPNPGLDQ